MPMPVDRPLESVETAACLSPHARLFPQTRGISPPVARLGPSDALEIFEAAAVTGELNPAGGYTQPTNRARSTGFVRYHVQRI